MPVTVSPDIEKEPGASMPSDSKVAFEQLYHAYGAQLMGYILKIVPDEKTAADVLQMAFVEIWDNKHEYAVPDTSLFICMLHVVKRYAIQIVAKENNEIRNTGPFVYISNVLNKKSSDGGSEELHKAFFELLHYHKCSIKDLAGLLNIDEYKIKTMLRSAVKNLKNPAL